VFCIHVCVNVSYLIAKGLNCSKARTLDSTAVDKNPKIIEPVIKERQNSLKRTINIECCVCEESAANLYRKI